MTSVARVPPTRQSRFPGRPLAQLNLRPPILVQPLDSAETAIAAMRMVRPSLALISDQGRSPPYAALTMTTAAALIADQAALESGLVDLSELTASDVAAAHPLELGEIDVRASSGDALSVFFNPDSTKPPVSVLLVRSANDDLLGAILRPDLRL